MSSGDLSFELPASLSVTWRIPDYFRLASESLYYLQSPHFTFADGRYCLRSFRIFGFDCIGIQLRNLNDTDPGGAALYDVQVKSRIGEIDMNRHAVDKQTFSFRESKLEGHRDLYVPDGTLTVLCSVRLRSPESGGAQAQAIPKYRNSSGELSFQSFPFLYVTWRTPIFSQLTRQSRSTLKSPEFPFSNCVYHLQLFPSRYDDNYVTIQLVNLTDTVIGRYVSYEVGLKSTTGEEIYIGRCDTHTTRSTIYFSRDELYNKKSEFFPDGHLTVFCSVRLREPSSAGSPNSVGAESQVFPGSKAAATHAKSVAVQTSNEEEDKEALPGGVAKVLSDYKRLLLKGAESDACLVVGGKEFQAHRNVLRARSPVFEAMFDHGTAEKASGRVVIDDLEPDRFQDFLEYLYTGRVESFCDDNAFGLYAAAYKYDVITLKKECVEYMRRSLSVDNFCDVITLALRHHEQDLLEQTVEFFKKNVAGIILTVKWQQFMSENSTRANELLIKLHVPGRESDNVLLP